MFEGFEEITVAAVGAGPEARAEVFARIGGPEGAPPVLLLHGYPQTSAMWHLVAPRLAARYRVIVPDLRGYGRSGKPGTETPGQDPTHALYSKRAMAGDLIALMDHLGHDRFLVGAHDRGARVAHRLGMDHGERVVAMTLLDIAPTREMYAHTTEAFARAYWHWFFLIQPYPMPEEVIGANPDAFWLGKNLKQAGGGSPFAAEALAEYLVAFGTPEGIHASCEDYRAAASIDIAHDDADGDAKLTMPLQVLWAEGGIIGRYFDPLALWRLRAAQVEGRAVPGSHYFAEEHPAQVAELFDAQFQARWAERVQ